MICYLDTSALIKLYIKEDGSEIVHEIAKNADYFATSKIAYVESISALVRLQREEKLHANEFLRIKKSFLEDWKRFIVIELTDIILNTAGELIEKYSLRGFDSIHLSSALMLKKQTKHAITGASWDARLWDAFRDHMEVFPPKRP